MNEERPVLIKSISSSELSSELCIGKSDTYVLFAVLSGWLRASLGGENILLGEGGLIIKSQGASLSVIGGSTERASVLISEFECPFLTDKAVFDKVIPLGKRKRRYLGEIIRELSSLDNDSARLEYKINGSAEPFGRRIILENALCSLLIRITRDHLEESDGDSCEDFEIRNKAQAVRRYLYENYRTRITLDSLCFLFRSNKTTICKQFREEYGMTVLEYLNSLRVKEAKRLLLEERFSVTEIADHLGFESIHYFTRFFKKSTGRSPTEYGRIIGQRQKYIES